MRVLEESNGYKKLVEAVIRDVSGDNATFNPLGCLSKCEGSKCFHKYCDKFKWIIDRANHYSEKTGIDAADVLDSWENDRNYWYMNYYQESSQPKIETDKIRVFETFDDLRESVGNLGFRCPCCNGVSKDAYACDSGIIVPKIKDGKDGPCNWKAYGLFKINTIHVFVKEKCAMTEIFMPVAWETQEAKQ